MQWKERKRKHDDAHFPLQGKGKRASRKNNGVPFSSPLLTNNTFNKRVVGWDRETDMPIYED